MAHTSWLDRVETQRVSERAHAMRPGETLLRLVIGFFFALGWLTAKVFTVAWLAIAFVCAAFAEGWQAGRPARPPG